jgi:hypothetical protein
MMIKLVRVTAVLAICLVSACSAQNAGPSASASASTSPSATPDVAILVLDQFTDPAAPTPTDSSTHEASTANCPASGLQANEVGSGGGGGGLPYNVSHGQAVFETVEEELNRPGRTLTPIAAGPNIADPNVAKTAAWTYHGDKILLVGVNTGHYDTNTISRNLSALITELHNDLSISRFVLNMSFSIVPCDLASWYNQHFKSDQDVTTMLTSYSTYLAGNPAVAELKKELDSLVRDGAAPVTVSTLLGNRNLAQIRDIVLANLYYGQLKADQLPSNDAHVLPAADPLATLLASLTKSPDYRVIPVAAAGNGVWLQNGNKAQLPFPTAPGIWNSVVSTSATDVTGTALAPYSNNGEVMMSRENPEGGIGTSFAAPHLSALEALYLLNDGTVTCDNHVPALGYADSDAGVDTWNNEWLGFGAVAAGAVPTTGLALGECGAFQTKAQ